MPNSIRIIFEKEKYRMRFSLICLAVILLAAFLLRYPLARRNLIWPWDESAHALVAKNLQHNFLEPYLYPENAPITQDYTDWNRNAAWLHKPPLSLWLISICFRIFGSEEWLIRLPSLLLSLGGIIIVYILGTLLFNRSTALVAALLYAFNPFLIVTSVGLWTTDHVDTALLFFELLTILFYILHARTNAKNKRFWFLIASGVFLGCALLSKSVMAIRTIILLFAFESMNQKKHWKKIFQITLIGFLVSLPWFLYTYVRWPREFIYENFQYLLHFNTGYEGHEHGFLYYLKTFPRFFGYLIYLFFIPIGLFLMYREQKFYNLKLLLCWFGLPLLMFSIIRTKLIGYTLIIYPAVFLTNAYVFSFLLRQKIAMVFKCLLVAICLFVQWIPYSQIHTVTSIGYLRFRDFTSVTSLRYDYDVFKEKMLALKGKEEKAIILNMKDLFQQAMFYSDYLAYDFIPDNEKILQLHNVGYKMYVIINRIFDNEEKTIKELKRLDIFIKKHNMNVEFIEINPSPVSLKYMRWRSMREAS